MDSSLCPGPSYRSKFILKTITSFLYWQIFLSADQFASLVGIQICPGSHWEDCLALAAGVDAELRSFSVQVFLL